MSGDSVSCGGFSDAGSAGSESREGSSNQEGTRTLEELEPLFLAEVPIQFRWNRLLRGLLLRNQHRLQLLTPSVVPVIT